MRRILIAMIVALMGSARLAAVDYEKIDQAIVKEPVYESGSPQYALLLFGPRPVRVWLVIDGETAYIDRNSDGDLTAANERLEKVSYGHPYIEIREPGSRTSYVISNVEIQRPKDFERRAYVSVMIFGDLQFNEYSDVALADSPRAATLAHFDGPLTIRAATVDGEQDPTLNLRTGKNGADMLAMVGTWTKFGRPVVVESHDGTRDALPYYSPIADIRFAAKEIGQPPVRQRYVLDRTCCGCIFKGEVLAPPEAGPGVAEVSLSFNMWKEGHVAPSTAEIPVVAPDRPARAAE